jgi:ATP-dependent Clp protease ATP-binding subunit ClpA
VEIPLAAECKKVLNMAVGEAERLAHRHLGTDHLLLGMLRLEVSLAAQILCARSVNPGMIREQLAKIPVPTIVKAQPAKQGFLRLDSFLAGLRWHKSEELAAFFAKNAQFVDAAGITMESRGGREAI